MLMLMEPWVNFVWLIGWGLVLEYAMGSMTVAVSWSGYFNKFLKIIGLHLPSWLTSDPASARSTFVEATNAIEKGGLSTEKLHETSGNCFKL